MPMYDWRLVTRSIVRDKDFRLFNLIHTQTPSVRVLWCHLGNESNRNCWGETIWWRSSHSGWLNAAASTPFRHNASHIPRTLVFSPTNEHFPSFGSRAPVTPSLTESAKWEMLSPSLSMLASTRTWPMTQQAQTHWPSVSGVNLSDGLFESHNQRNIHPLPIGRSHGCTLHSTQNNCQM